MLSFLEGAQLKATKQFAELAAPFSFQQANLLS